MCSGDTESPCNNPIVLGAGVSRLKSPSGEEIVRVLRSLGFYVTEAKEQSVVLARGIHRLEIPLGETDGNKSKIMRQMLKPVFDHQDWDKIKRIRDWVVATDLEADQHPSQDNKNHQQPNVLKISNS
jgi:hypothetical protein